MQVCHSMLDTCMVYTKSLLCCHSPGNVSSNVSCDLKEKFNPDSDSSVKVMNELQMAKFTVHRPHYVYWS